MGVEGLALRGVQMKTNFINHPLLGMMAGWKHDVANFGNHGFAIIRQRKRGCQ